MTNDTGIAAVDTATSIWRKPLRLPPVAPYFRRGGVFAKDLVHHAKILLTMLLASGVAVYLPWLMEILEGDLYRIEMRRITENASSIYLALLITCAFVFGLVLSADEVENHTTVLLDTMPCSRMRHFAHKFALGALMLAIWTVLAALLMGWLSLNGTSLLRSLFHDKISLFSVALNFPSSGPITLLQCLSLLVTGMVCGLLFQNLATSAIVGIIAYCCFLATVGKLLLPRNASDGKILLINASSLIVWTTLMLLAYPRVFAQSHFQHTGVAGVESARSWLRRVGELLQYHRSGSTAPAFDPPQRYLLRVPVFTLCVVCVLGPLLIIATKHDQDNAPLGWLMLVFGVPLSAALIGTGAWLSEERVSPRFSLYTLPVQREHVYWPRIARLLLSALAICVAIVIGFSFIYVYETMRRDHVESLADFPIELLLFICGTIGSLMSLGAMFRLFYRSRLVAAILGGVVYVVWAIVAGIGWTSYAATCGYQSPPRPGQVWMGYGPLFHALWILAVAVGLPVFVGYLGFCKTRLLETSERTRGSLSLVIFVLFAVWGSFLINTVPEQFLTMIFVR